MVRCSSWRTGNRSLDGPTIRTGSIGCRARWTSPSIATWSSSGGGTRHHGLIAAEVVRPGVVTLLDEATAAGIPVGVASSSTVEWVEGHLDRLGVLDRFDVVRCRDHVERAKPSPDLFVAALAALGADPARSVALEDSHHGCTAAKAAGMVCVVVPNDVTRSQSFDHADLVVESLTEVSVAALTRLIG